MNNLKYWGKSNTLTTFLLKAGKTQNGDITCYYSSLYRAGFLFRWSHLYPYESMNPTDLSPAMGKYQGNLGYLNLV